MDPSVASSRRSDSSLRGPMPTRKNARRSPDDVIDPERFRRTRTLRGWNLGWQVENCHVPFVPVRGAIPDHSKTPKGEKYSRLQRMLQIWNADLGARANMDWSGFLGGYRRTLKPLTNLPSLGALTEADLQRVLSVVAELESFKPTKGRALVFGSKAAHFHFPWMVPVISSEVRRGLSALERARPEVLRAHLGARPDGFEWTGAEANRRSYEAYLRLGNALMRGVDARVVADAEDAPFDLAAKVFEWCVVSFDPLLAGEG